ncbi:MAG: hypothetical protein VXY92_13970 [Planctomycetota bacterium]|nr:hypothetical protein [Planctomycetota bacterium]
MSRTPLLLSVPRAAVATLALLLSVDLSAQGGGLEGAYQKQLDGLRAELKRKAPKVRATTQKAFAKAQDAEKAAKKALDDAKAALGEVSTCKALVGHAKGKWIGGADRGIQQANQMMAKAKTSAEKEAAAAELVKWQQNRKEGEQALKERQANLDRALKRQPKLERAVKSAESKLKRAKATAAKALQRLGLSSKLASSDLDHDLARFVVLNEATPKRLAAFAERGPAQKQLVDRLLADGPLMLQMVVADGAKGGEYGRAMEIYAKIQAERPKARAGALQRLAVAIALEHAQPVKQRNATGAEDAPEHVDPFGRYCHYEEAFEKKELDACFGQLTVWDYRMVVDGEEPDEIAAWGREMLRSYRPDHIFTKDDRWRYVGAVGTEIRYGSQDNHHDRSDVQFFQNILMNGGVCGRRAFFGRFLLRAFGVPTTARPQRGHAALVHWTPKGWVPCLGAGWGSGWTRTRYNKDLDFLATTQARRDSKRYLEVKRAQWIGDVVGERPVYGLLSGEPGFWYGTSLHRQRQIIEQTDAQTLQAVGADLGEAEDERDRFRVAVGKVTEDDRRIDVDAAGVITIPAVACTKPGKSNRKVVFLPSNLGGKQLHYNRNGGGQVLEYTFEAPAAGTYRLTARVASPSWQQHLHVSANGGASADLALPHTVGLWGESDGVDVTLVAGANVLRLEHKSEGHAKGFSIKDFRLTPQ